MTKDARYRRIDVDTLETMSVMLNIPFIWKEREKYMEKNEENEEEYDMCQAIRELEEEARSIGFAEVRRTVVRNMLVRDMADEDIMAIAECDLEFIDEVRMDIP